MKMDKITNPNFKLMKGAIYPVINTDSLEITHFVVVDSDYKQVVVGFDFNDYTRSFKKCEHEYVPINTLEFGNHKVASFEAICRKCGYKPDGQPKLNYNG